MTRDEQSTGSSIWVEVLRMKETVIAQLGVSGADNAKLRELTDWLKRELDLEAKYKGLMSDAQRLLAERNKPPAAETAQSRMTCLGPQTEGTPDEYLRAHAGKSGAGDFRQAYLMREKQRGKHLTKVGRVYYRDDEGVILGVTFSSEDKGKRESTWFLNLKDKEFHEAVLLCQVGPEAARVVHLPRAVIDKFTQKFSRDEKGMVKFNLAKRDGNFWLQVPGPTGWVDVEEYADGELVVPRRPDYL